MKKITLVLLCCGFLLSFWGCNGSGSDYTVTTGGYGGDIAVTLTVDNGKISKIKVVGDKETEGVGSLAVQQLPAKIIDAQTWDVDVVTGATITSTSIKKATKQAMADAGLIEADAGSSGPMTLESINEFLNTNADMGEGTVANAVAVIPIDHVNGPREEHDFYAFVNFKYKARNYVKYQITYLSCTCRSSDVNYWMTAYVEMTLPSSGNIEDSEVRFLSFDRDSTGHYIAGFWGDSSPTPAGHTYEQIKADYIPFFIGKTYGYLKNFSTVDDIPPADYAAGEGREGLTVDAFTGSSVSTNNIIRMLNALFAYHGTDSFFQK